MAIGYGNLMVGFEAVKGMTFLNMDKNFQNRIKAPLLYSIFLLYYMNST